jgi:hypothetical protein
MARPTGTTGGAPHFLIICPRISLDLSANLTATIGWNGRWHSETAAHGAQKLIEITQSDALASIFLTLALVNSPVTDSGESGHSGEPVGSGKAGSDTARQ